MRVYLAHPVTDYGTERQSAAIALICSRGWQVENPDQPHHEAAYRSYGMAHFMEVVEDCDGLAFLRFDDSTIGAGVAKEIETALRRGLTVWDASNGDLLNIGSMMPTPILTVEQTRAKVREMRGIAA